MTVMYGPRPDEGPPPYLGPIGRVAVLSDVHANAPAFEAVLADIEAEGPDLIVSCGDLTWGSEPEITVSMARALGDRAVFVRGNAERAVIDLADGSRQPDSERDRWMVAQHSLASIAFVSQFAFSVIVDIVGLGRVRFCHGSPRSDTELVTPGTPVDRFAALSTGIPESTVVSGHTHLQFDRTFDGALAGRRSVNPGSVGLPYHDGQAGTAYWALLGPDVELRQTAYDLDTAITQSARAGDPATDRIAEILRSPPSVAEVIEHAESREFSD